MPYIAQAFHKQQNIRFFQNELNQIIFHGDLLYTPELGQKKDTPNGVSSFLSNPQFTH
jgi:hypothetical protein